MYLTFKSTNSIHPMNKDLILREKLAIQRTNLANQTTFLAFLRTAMYFLIAGVSVNNLTSIYYGNFIEFSFISIAFALFVIGIVNYRKQRTKILHSEIHIGSYKDDYLSGNE